MTLSYSNSNCCPLSVAAVYSSGIDKSIRSKSIDCKEGEVPFVHPLQSSPVGDGKEEKPMELLCCGYTLRLDRVVLPRIVSGDWFPVTMAVVFSEIASDLPVCPTRSA